MQGRVYSCRNTLQFFTIPLGFFLGGVLVDEVFSPLMAAAPPGGMLDRLFGGPGAGAAATFCVLAVMGVGGLCGRSFSFCAGNPGAMEIPLGKSQTIAAFR